MPRRCGHTLRHFTLHHHHGQFNRILMAAKVKQDVARDVVRQVANHQRFLTCWKQGSDVRLQDVGFDHLNVRVVAKPEPQLGHQRPVQFNADQFLRTPRQDRGDRTVPRANLNDCAFADISHRIRNAVAGTVIHQEVLSELWLAWLHLIAVTCPPR